jgi:oligopeptide/dipeptide ABC transporter ATP-binding protein
VPNLSALPPGCKFVTRCPYAQAVCASREPPLMDAGGHLARCHAYQPDSGYVVDEDALALRA